MKRFSLQLIVITWETSSTLSVWRIRNWKESCSTYLCLCHWRRIWFYIRVGVRLMVCAYVLPTCLACVNFKTHCFAGTAHGHFYGCLLLQLNFIANIIWFYEACLIVAVFSVSLMIAYHFYSIIKMLNMFLCFNYFLVFYGLFSPDYSNTDVGGGGLLFYELLVNCRWQYIVEVMVLTVSWMYGLTVLRLVVFFIACYICWEWHISSEFKLTF